MMNNAFLCLNSKGSSIQGGTMDVKWGKLGERTVSILKVVRFKGEHCTNHHEMDVLHRVSILKVVRFKGERVQGYAFRYDIFVSQF